MIRVGDCREVMAEMEPDSVDAIVTDPPYGLEFMGKEWDRLGDGFRRRDNESDAGRDNAFGRTSRTSPEYHAGQQAQAFHESWAVEALGVLKPGGHLLAFGGSRTYHRLACAIEDAGFEIRDQIQWLYGSGFPKSYNLDGDWTGWGTALKPALEPVVVARKPLIGTIVENVEQYGTGAINIDATRIPAEPGGAYTNHTAKVGREPGWNGKHTGKVTENPGRWPANVVLDPEAAAMLDEQSGELRAGGKASGPTLTGHSDSVARGHFNGTEDTPFYGDSGGASRFFYCAKASREERGRNNHHPTVKPVALMRWLVRLVTPPHGLVLDPFAGSGTTGIACSMEGFRFIGIEQSEEYAEIARRRIIDAPLGLPLHSTSAPDRGRDHGG